MNWQFLLMILNPFESSRRQQNFWIGSKIKKSVSFS